MGRRTSSTKRTASAAMANPGVIVYADGAATAAVCDADSSAAATVALRPLGALAQSVASGDEVEILPGPGCTLVATGAVQEGDLLVSAYQPKSAMVQVFFEPETALSDSLTYDITAWSAFYRLPVLT